MDAALDMVRAGVGALLIAGGLAFLLGGAIGVLRFPDFYTRLHAARAADGVGAVLFLIGLAVLSGDIGIALRLIVLAILVAALAPTLAHVAANAAHLGGLTPLVGAYKAPRPGARKQAP